MSTINHLSVEELQQRWKSDAAFAGFREAVLFSNSSEEWFHRLPKLIHPWERDEMGDFRGVSFANLKLVKVDLTSLRFDYANFSGCDLLECSFQGAVFSDVTFEKAKLTRAHMIPIYGERVIFDGAELDKSSLEYSKLPQARFTSATLNKVTLANADLSQSSFVGAKVQECRFGFTTLRETDLTRAEFSNCDMRCVELQHAQLVGSALQNCDMSGADFRGANLARAKIRGGKFSVVQQGNVFTPTRFDDTPEARKLVAESGAVGIETIEWAPVNSIPAAAPKRVMAGEPCTRNGFWFTPASTTSRRYFTVGQTFPEVKSDYGAAIWQWDQNQEPPKL